MKTSRIARETARISQHSEIITTRRTTRSFAKSIHGFAAEDAGVELNQEISRDDDASSLSSVNSKVILDIEESITPKSTPRKRKRGFESPITAATALPAVTTRTSPLKEKSASQNGQQLRPRIKKGRRQPAKQVVTDDGEVEIHPPANWAEIYSAVQEMRKRVLAPVDTMGCERIAEDKRTPRVKRFQTLIALMLSSQTKDTTNAIAMRRLQTELPQPGLTLENILAVEPTRLNELIYAVGFHNNKTRYIKAAALVLRDQFDGDIPDTVEGLMSLPGVGPKMAYLCMSSAWGQTVGIGVDVHVHRITNLWGWHKTREPEETRKALEAWLPREKWHEINHLLVGFGQTICLPVGRRCGNCTLSTRGLCPGAVTAR